MAENQDLGLGSKVVEENRSRFVNHDGTFNVRRKGVFEHGSFSPYHAFLSMSWTQFYAAVFGYYVVANLFFTGLYFLCGPMAFPGIAMEGLASRFGEIFFFSVQVITTIGSSSLQPVTLLGRGVVALEAVVGLLGFAIAAGLIFARFSNPATKILFSNRAVIAPYNKETGFMVRLVNGRSNELIEVNATVTLALIGKNGKRGFHQLSLEREGILVFPLSWTIVHPITKESPLYGLSIDDIQKAQAEFVIGISATDPDLSKRVYARHSYIANEIASGVRFTNILERTGDGTVVIDPARIHEIEKVA